MLEIRKDRPKAKSIGFLMILLFLSSVIIYRDFIFGNSLLAFVDVGSDTWQQYVMQYNTIVNHIRNGNISAWDFNNGFGASMFQLNLFDPSLMLVYVIGAVFGPEHMAGVLVYVQILKILLAGLVSYYFLSEYALSEKSKIFASYIYGLNGFLMVWGQHYQFGIITVYLPLILLMVERSMKRKKVCAGLPLSVFLAVIDSTYFGYMCCLTAGIFLIFRILLEETQWKRRLGIFIRICMGMLLGVGMGLLILMPVAYLIFNVTSRLDSDTSLMRRLLQGFLPQDREYYKTLLYRFFSANLRNKNGGYVGMPGYNYYEDPSVFASIFFVILGGQYLFVLWRMKISRYRKAVLYGAAALAGFALTFPLIGIVFNGFSTYFNRFTFALMPFFVLLIAWMADYILDGGKISFTALSGVLITAVYIYRMGYYITGNGMQKRLILAMAAVAVVSVLSIGALGIKKLRRYHRPLCFLILFLAVADMCLEGTGTVTDREIVEKDDTLYLSELYSEDVQEALRYIRENDEEFCRVEKTYPENVTSMSSLVQYYRGISTYNSMQNGNILDFVHTYIPQLFFANFNYFRYSQMAMDGELDEFLGIKYLLSKDEAPQNYELVQEFGTVKLYQARKDVSLGRFYPTDAAITEEEFRGLVGNQSLKEEREKRNRVLQSMIGLDMEEAALEEKREASNEKETAPEEASVSLRSDGNDSHLYGEVNAPCGGYVLFTIPFEGGWKIRVDGEAAQIYKADIGFMGIWVNEGEHEITLDYQPPLFKTGIGISALCWLFYICYFAVYRRKGVRTS